MKGVNDVACELECYALADSQASIQSLYTSTGSDRSVGTTHTRLQDQIPSFVLNLQLI